ncbi:tyrosine-type recombinase/integrase [Dichelobacter nodosus]|uniref:tyrosine-type recombinase/integrase n=1 Tax=Dichelobacter nodosus TaxID=870 RepID=UPI00068075F8|nr:integrase arm-type DNA-binding domain-containing protein [Dichelobacter nodosus]KNZ39975.1 hypothetical protein AKG33_01110 [Dichelobacter nodosus]
MALTEIQCRNAAVPEKGAKKYFDGGGLCLLVTAKGQKYWRLFYRMPHTQKQQSVSFGVYPKVSLKQARQRRDEIKLIIAKGINPQQAAKQLREEKAITLKNTFESTARACIENISVVKQWSERHKKSTLSRLVKYVFPRLGEKPVVEIEPLQILTILQEMQSVGKIESSHKLLSSITQVFNYAMITNRACRYNPAAELSKLIKPSKNIPYRHITDPIEIGKLLIALDEYAGTPQGRNLARLHPLIFIRPSEIRLMKWSEINFEEKLWQRMPTHKRKKNVNAVPFSNQAWEMIRELHTITCRTEYVFCNLHTGKPYSDGAERKVLKRIGYLDKIVPHGWRHTASTLLHNQNYQSIWVEKQLGHSDKNQIRGTYNHADYLEQRRKMLQEWADYLDMLRENVSHYY